MAVLQALYFNIETISRKANNPSHLVICFLCDLKFEICVGVTKNSYDGTTLIRDHMVKEHSVIISNIDEIADIAKYFAYWKEKFSSEYAMEKILKPSSDETQKSLKKRVYYILAPDILPEDAQLRQTLMDENLRRILVQQQLERETSDFSRQCLFCKRVFTGNCSSLLNHMMEFHSFNIGHPENLVFKEEFIEKLDQKVKKLSCFYCEKTFKDWWTLKEHMRKKQHKRLNPNNKEYDRFYIVNYIANSERDPSADDVDDSWDDWIEDEADCVCVCLFCDNSSNYKDVCQHMKDIHGFEMNDKHDIHEKIKLVNFIRSCIHHNTCIYCQEVFTSKDNLLQHFNTTHHSSMLPNETVWDSPEYYFPVFENDNLLHLIEYADDDETTKRPS